MSRSRARLIRVLDMPWRTHVPVFSVLLLLSPALSLFGRQANQESLPAETTDQVLRKHGMELSREGLIAALANPDAKVRIAAANKLAENEDRGAVPFIARAVSAETDPINRINMALPLAELGDLKADDLLRNACANAKLDAGPRVAAAHNMLLLGSDACLPNVVSIIEADRTPDGVSAALNLLPHYFENTKRTPREVLDLICKRLTDSSPFVRLTATNVLATLGTSAQVPALQNAIAKEPEMETRRQMEEAVKKLQSIAPK